MADEQKKIEEGEEEEKRNIIPSYASRSEVEWSGVAVVMYSDSEGQTTCGTDRYMHYSITCQV